MKRNRLTVDRGGAGPPSTSQGFHTTSKIGVKRHLTREGFLLCQDVAVARTGWMIYAPGEVPVDPGPDGYIMVMRDAETLFDAVSIASFAGKPVTNDHPTNGVDPSNSMKVTVGTVHNPRQGIGADRDVLIADLLITDAQAIRDVQRGKVEVSAGYEATYERTGLGQARQLNIVGNHIALVNRGRCGPRCAIGDKMPTSLQRKQAMPQAKPRVAVSDTARQMIIDAAAALGAEDEVIEDESPNAMHIHLHTGAPAAKTKDGADDPEDTEDKSPMGMRMKKVEDTVQKMADSLDAFIKAKPNTADAATLVTDHEGAGTAGDSKALETGFKAVMSDAEVLVPGFSMPTFDAAATRAVTVDSMCATRRRVLDAALLTSAGKTLIETVSPGLNTATADCVTVAGAFRAAAGAKRLLNNGGRATNDQMSMADPNANKPKPKMSLADLNAANRKLYPV